MWGNPSQNGRPQQNAANDLAYHARLAELTRQPSAHERDGKNDGHLYEEEGHAAGLVPGKLSVEMQVVAGGWLIYPPARRNLRSAPNAANMLAMVYQSRRGMPSPQAAIPQENRACSSVYGNSAPSFCCWASVRCNLNKFLHPSKIWKNRSMSATTTTPSKIFAERIGRIEVSATMAVTAEAARLRAQGAKLVDFGAGEPHFATPRHIKDAAIKAIDENFTRYTTVSGIPEVRKAIVERHACDFGSDYTPEEAVFTTGGKLAIFNAIQVLVDHGDEVILPVPYWVSYKDIIQYGGGKPVFLETDEAENFRVTAEAIEKAITPRTKAILINSPSNPAGSVISPADLERIVKLAHERGIYLLLDECYVYLQYTGALVSGGSFTEAKEHVIVLGSLSKTYAMTGWRAGFAL